MSINLKERAVLMRFSAGLPGEQRQDQGVTADVKRDKQLGERAGKWEKFLYPPEALMAEVLSRKNPRIYETLTGNIREICRVAPALNMADDPTVAGLVKECEDLARVNPETLRQSQGSRDTARAKAEALVAKLSAYKL